MSTIIVSSGVTSSGLVVSSGDTLIVSAGGTLQDVTVLHGGLLQDYGVVDGALGEGLTSVYAGGVLSGMLAVAHGSAYIGSGGQALDTFVGPNGFLSILSGGYASGATLSGGGNFAGEFVHAGGTAVAITALDGGSLEDSGGATISGVLIGSGAYVSVSDTLSGATVGPGGVFVYPTVVSSGAVLVAQPTQVVTPFTSRGITVQSGAFTVANATVVSSGGVYQVPEGVAALATVTVLKGGQIVGPGALFGAVIDYGVASGIAVTYVFDVESGAVASNVIVEQYGAELVLSGGQSVGGAVLSGSLMELAVGAGEQGVALQAGGAIAVDGVFATSAGFNPYGQLSLYGSDGGALYNIGLSAQNGHDLAFKVVVQPNLGSLVLVTGSTAQQDLYGLGRSEVLIRDVGGAMVAGELSPNGLYGYQTVGALGPDWTFRGTGDFLGGGPWGYLEQESNGLVMLAQVKDGHAAYSAVAALGAEWSFRATGDFLGQGQADVLIENTGGLLDVGQIGTHGQMAFTTIGALGPEWSFAGAGDFLGDGRDGFLLKNKNGVVAVGEVVGGQAAYTAVGALGSEWSFLGAGDFLGDGQADFLMENTAGALVLGKVSGGAAGYTLVGALGPDWSFEGVGDYAGAGVDSALFQNTGNGALVTATAAAGQFQYALVGGLGSNWTFQR